MTLATASALAGARTRSRLPPITSTGQRSLVSSACGHRVDTKLAAHLMRHSRPRAFGGPGCKIRSVALVFFSIRCLSRDDLEVAAKENSPQSNDVFGGELLCQYSLNCSATTSE